MVLEFVGELVETRDVDPWLQARVMGSDAVLDTRARGGRAEGPAQGVVDDLLGRAPLAMHGIFEQANNVGVQRQCCPHACIMMPRQDAVKMYQCLRG